MNRLPNGLVLSEMAGKLQKGQISQQDFSEFKNNISNTIKSLISEGRDSEIKLFYKESDKFFILEMQLFLDEIKDRSLNPVYTVLNNLNRFMPEEVSEKIKDFIKEQLKLYHQAMSKMAIEMLEFQTKQTRNACEKFGK